MNFIISSKLSKNSLIECRTHVRIRAPTRAHRAEDVGDLELYVHASSLAKRLKINILLLEGDYTQHTSIRERMLGLLVRLMVENRFHRLILPRTTDATWIQKKPYKNKGCQVLNEWYFYGILRRYHRARARASVRMCM